MKRLMIAILLASSLTACSSKWPWEQQQSALATITRTPSEGETLTQFEGERVWYLLPQHAGKVVQPRYQEGGQWKDWKQARITSDGSFDQHVSSWSGPIQYSVLDQSGNPVLSWTTNIVQPGQGISSWSTEGLKQFQLASLTPPPAPAPMVQMASLSDNQTAESRAKLNLAQAEVDSLSRQLPQSKKRLNSAQAKLNRIWAAYQKGDGKGCKCSPNTKEWHNAVKARDDAKVEVAAIERQLESAKRNLAQSDSRIPPTAGTWTPPEQQTGRLAATGIPSQLTPSGDRCGSNPVMDQTMQVPGRGQRIIQNFGTAMNYRDFPGKGTQRFVMAEWLSDSGVWKPMDRGFPLNISPNDSGHMRQFFCDWSGDGARNKTLRYTVQAQGGASLGSWEVKLQ